MRTKEEIEGALDQIMNRNIMLRMMAEVDANPSDRP
jgi:hypothetical protein